MSLLAKIHAVRSRGLTVVKTGKISGGINAQFASYPDVWAALSPALTEAGLSVGFCGSELGIEGESEWVEMEMEISDGVEAIQRKWGMLVPERIQNSRGSSVTNNAQRVANAQSYLKRTALIHYFGMSAGNEDEVERMMPHGDQSNIPGLVMVTSATIWQALTDGTWRDVMSPLEDGKLEAHTERGAKYMNELWKEYPDHPGVMAYWADWLSGTMQNGEIPWADLMDRDASLPTALQACNPEQLRSAARAMTEILKAAKEAK